MAAKLGKSAQEELTALSLNEKNVATIESRVIPGVDCWLPDIMLYYPKQDLINIRNQAMWGKEGGGGEIPLLVGTDDLRLVGIHAPQDLVNVDSSLVLSFAAPRKTTQPRVYSLSSEVIAPENSSLLPDLATVRPMSI